MSDDDRTASLMTPAKLAQLKVRPAQAASPAAWLDQLATDAGSGHVRRLLDLRGQLASQAGDPPPAAAGQACTQLAEALAALEFSLLEPRGWLARATGKGREAAAGFRSQSDRCARTAEAVASELRALQRRQQVQAPALDRTVEQCEVEVRALAKIMDQGTRWLQDMRGQLKAREAEGGDAAALQKIQEDTRRCELLVARLKLLRAVEATAGQVLERCRATAPRRAALVASLQQALEGWKDASRRLDAVAEQASGTPAAAATDARQATAALARALQQVAAEAGSLQAQEQSLAGELAALQEPLQAAA